MLSEPPRDRTRTSIRTTRGLGLALAGCLSSQQKRFFEPERARFCTCPMLLASVSCSLARLFKAVLAVPAGALVHLGLGYVGTSTTGDPFFDALSDKAAPEEGATLYSPVGLGVPGDPPRIRQDGSLF